MKDHHPDLSGKELRLLRAELQEREQSCRIAYDTARAALKQVEADIDRLDETVLARRRVNMLAQNEARARARERGEP